MNAELQNLAKLIMELNGNICRDCISYFKLVLSYLNACGCRRAILPGQLPVDIYTVTGTLNVIHSLLSRTRTRVNLHARICLGGGASFCASIHVQVAA